MRSCGLEPESSLSLLQTHAWRLAAWHSGFGHYELWSGSPARAVIVQTWEGRHSNAAEPNPRIFSNMVGLTSIGIGAFADPCGCSMTISETSKMHFQSAPLPAWAFLRRFMTRSKISSRCRLQFIYRNESVTCAFAHLSIFLNISLYKTL